MVELEIYNGCLQMKLPGARYDMYVGRSGNRSELETLLVVCPSTDSLGESMRSTARGYATSEGQDSQEKKECFRKEGVTSSSENVSGVY